MVLLVAADVIAWLLAVLVTGTGLAGTLFTGIALSGSRTAGRVHRRRLWLSWLEALPRSAATAGIAFAVVTAAALATGWAGPEITEAQRLVLVFALLSEAVRPWIFALGRWGRRRLRRCDRTIVVGSSESGGDLVRAMLQYPEFGLKPVGFVPAGQDTESADIPTDLVEADLAEAISRLGAGTVVLAHSGENDGSNVDAVVTAHRLGCATLALPRLSALVPDGPGIDRLRDYPLVWLAGTPTRRPSWWIKRAVETAAAAVALAALCPLVAVCLLAVLMESGRPVIFRQVRVGMRGQTFVLYKIRSVRPDAADDSPIRWSVAGDSRVGPIGRVLRRTSLDELPQLWNVVRGDMALVGPRPERPVFVDKFSAVHDLYWARHRVPTGLTGLAQVHGLRGDTSIADRARYDNYYIANWSLWLDVKIIILTVGELLCRRQR